MTKDKRNKKRNCLLLERVLKMLLRNSIRDLQTMSFVSHREDELKHRFHDRRGGGGFRMQSLGTRAFSLFSISVGVPQNEKPYLVSFKKI